MSIVGRENVFGIEWSIDSYHPPYIIGYLCFWINNERVGDIDELATLSISVSYLRDFLKNEEVRVFQGSQGMSKDDLFYLLYGRFFGGSIGNNEEHLQMHKFAEAFWLDQVGEYSFRDKLWMVLVNEPGFNRQRIIWKDLITGNLKEFFLPEKCFDITALDFLDALNNQIANFNRDEHMDY